MHALMKKSATPTTAPITPMFKINLKRENPAAKIAVNSFRLFNLLIEKREATRQETGKILIINVGISR